MILKTLRSATVMVACLLLTGPSQGQELLPRRPFMGMQMETISMDQKQELGLSQDTYGIYIKGTLEGSPAAIAGLRKGDVIEYLNDTKVNTTKDLLYAIRDVRNTSTATFTIYRDTKKKKIKIKLIPFPMEEHPDFETEYLAALSGENVHRVIVTRPRNIEKAPAVLMVQGVGCFSQDNMNNPALRSIVDSLTMNGFVVMRVEKSGIGDSRGKPCAEINLEEEVGGYMAGLKLLKSLSYVDSTQVFAFGMSMGGIIAPILNLQESLAGIIAYGTIGRNWFEYELMNSRRQFELVNSSSDSLDSFMRREYNKLYGLFVAMANPTDIIRMYPWTEKNLFVYPMSFEYFQQVAQIDITTLWLNTNIPVLAIHGSADFVSSSEDHKRISEYVNERSPGMGEYMELSGTDHWLDNAEDELASVHKQQQNFNPAIIRVMIEWFKARIPE
jgi:alpha-beta hydrolase superfamily lysophospholipase